MRKTTAQKREELKARIDAFNVTYHTTDGNGKTGIPSFNTLAGDWRHAYTGYVPGAFKDIAEDIHGTCSKDCPGCYAKRETRYPDTMVNMIENTLLVLSGDYERLYTMLAEYFRTVKPLYFRIHDSGDFIDYGYFLMWDRLSVEFPETKFYAYTKEIHLIKRYRQEHNMEKQHFHLNVSTWQGVCEEKDLKENLCDDYARFEYDDHNRPELNEMYHCPAVDQNGKAVIKGYRVNRNGKTVPVRFTCLDCKRCILGNDNTRTAVYGH